MPVISCESLHDIPDLSIDPINIEDEASHISELWCAVCGLYHEGDEHRVRVDWA